jgi:hypothetical protein
VDVQVERGAEALNEGDRTALLRMNVPRSPLAATVLCEQRADERARHLARELRVVRTAVAEREHPLPDRNLGQHAIDEMRCGVRDAPTSARGTEAAAFARKSDQAVVATRIAVEAQEAMRKLAAAEEGAKLLLDEARGRLLFVRGAREEAFELLPNDPMKEGRLWLTTLVLGQEVPGRDWRGEHVTGAERYPLRRAGAGALRGAPSAR